MSVIQFVQHYFDLVYQYTIDNERPILQYMGGALAMAVYFVAIIGLHRWEDRRHQRKVNAVRGNLRERWMTTPERENQLKVLMSDGICDVIEDLIAKSKMTEEEGVIWYRRYGNLLNLPDLLTKHEVKLKEQLRKALTRKKNVIPFPDTKPVEGKKVRLITSKAKA